MTKDLKQGLALGVAFAALVSVMPTKAEPIEERCIPELSVDQIRRDGNDALLFEMRNGDVYRNELRGGRLYGLKGDPLIFDRTHRSSQYCNLDRVGVYNPPVRPHFPHFSGSFSASLGKFVKVVEAE